VLGRPIDRPAAFLSDVGALIEGPAFYPSLGGRRNLEVLAITGGHDGGRIPQLLELVGLAGRGEDRYRSYSLGMKQRLGIAAALLGDPELLILDEPANGLDPQGVQEMRGLIGRLAGGGRTVLVSSHDLSELEQVCDWVVLIEGGRALYEGPTGDLLDRGGRLALLPERAADAVRLAELLRCHDFEVGHEDGRVVVCTDRGNHAAIAAAANRLAFDAGIVLVELSPVRTTLEERYLSMVEVGAQ
jgi:ABC-2 type transport system ATP-binding protein